MANSSNRWIVLVPLMATLMLVGLWSFSLPGALIVYCAHDAVYAKQILDEFSRQTGIAVEARFDTEATKSLGLINLIVQERQQPRCDVFWNNELLGMVELREQGLLEPYRGTGWNRIPEQYRDPEGYWVGFAARMRVMLFNIHQVSAAESTFQTLLNLEPGRVSIAKPLFGTTLTHYTVLWHLWGPDRLKAWHNDLRLRGVREVDGNAAVKDVVAMGACDAGLTDNDDAFVALDDHQPVEMLPVRLAAMGSEPAMESERRADRPSLPQANAGTNAGANPVNASMSSSYTICIPNTVGIIKGTKRLTAAQRLVDFLASAETELALARSKSRQIPLGPVEPGQLPEEVKTLAKWSGAGIDLRSLLPARRLCLKWLQNEYVK